MNERPAAVTFLGKPLTLTGTELGVGDKVPDVTLLNSALEPLSLSSLQGSVIVLATVPSIDTPVCDTEVRRFNEEASSLGEDVRVVTVSMDLPFAQKRWCGAAGIDKVLVLSDHRSAELGTGLGILVKELRLLARSVFVIDKEGIIRYRELVAEIAEEPDYVAALEAAKEIL